MTLLCVPITVDDPARALDHADEAKRAGADVLEFRFDGAFERDIDAEQIEQAVRLVKQAPLPVIATCRTAEEGGGYAGDDDARAELFAALLGSDAPPRWIDVELASWKRSAALRDAFADADPSRTGLILSTHDFQGRPADLLRRVREMAEEPRASVHKITFRARSLRDNLEIAEILAQRTRPTIALAMGEFGLMSRVLAKKWGGFLTFASLHDTTTTAPGQPTVEELLTQYRFRSIARGTRVFGVVGWPVAHSLSPCAHNAAFADAGVDAVYLPMPVPPEWEHFKATVGAISHDERLSLGGLSVTAPHKRHLVRLAHEEGWSIQPGAERVGAANTLVVGPGGSVRVHDTDGPAVVALLRDTLGDMQGKRILLLGGGGVARSIGAALAEAGANIDISARREEQEKEVRDLLGSVGTDSPGRLDAVVNCTPVGMLGGPAEGESAIEESRLRELADANPGLVVLDTVYRPLETPLLALARSMGLRTVDGASMFVRQAEGQFHLWTGRDPAPGLADRVVRDRLDG